MIYLFNFAKLLTFFIIVFISFPALAVTNTIIFQEGRFINSRNYFGTEDTWLDPRNPDTAMGNNNNILIKPNNGAKAFIRFDLSSLPSDAIVINATLSLYCYEVERTDTGPIEVHYGIRPDWIEDKATWNKYDGENFWSTSGGDYDSSIIWNWNSTQNGIKMTNTWADFDVTSKINNNYNSKVGFVILSRSGYGWVYFYSSECSKESLRPKLTVTFNSNTPSANAGLDQDVGKNALVTLDGTGSSDPNEDSKNLIYSWNVISKPWYSNVTDNDIFPNNVQGIYGSDMPTFKADALGTYIIELTVTNSLGLSSKDSVKVVSSYINSEHPRIWLTPEHLTKLNARMKANTKEWLNWKRKVLDLVDYDNRGDMFDYALAYQVTREVKYKELGINRIKEILTYPIMTTNGGLYGPFFNAYMSRFWIPELAIGFDWLYYELDIDTKNNIVNKLNQVLDCIKNGTGDFNYDHNGCGNYAIGYLFAIGLASLATYGDNPRAQEFYNYARYTQFENIVIGLRNIGYGGDWTEGSYNEGNYERLAGYIYAVKTGTGENLLKYTNYLEEAIYFTIHATEPNLAYIQTYDDWPRGDNGLISEQRYRYMNILAFLFNDTEAGAYAQWWLNHVYVQNITCWQKFLWYNPDAIEKNIDQLPLAHYAPGTSMIISRSNWTINATVISFRNFPGNGHTHADANHFMIYKNGRQIIESNSGTLQDTWLHNSILINNSGQNVFRGYALPSNFEDNAYYTYIKGNATKAYYHSLLNNFVRQIIFLRPDYFIIFDRVSTTDPSYSKEWLLHTKNEPQINGNLVIAINDTGKLFSKTLLPLNFAINKIDENTLRRDLHTWRIVVQPTEARNDDLFLHVLYATDISTPDMPTTIRIDGNNIVGVQILNNITIFSKEEKQLDSGQFNITGFDIYKTIIADLIPNSNYDVFIDKNQLGTYRASNNGVLAFDLPLNGSHSVIISSGPIDNTKPAAISDLKANSGEQPGSVVLTWTATGDDDNYGTATSYIIKYYTSTISSANWDLATDVIGEPLPKSTGANETFTISGLTPGRTYYFAIRAVDEMGNISDISNSPSAVSGTENLGQAGKPFHID